MGIMIIRNPETRRRMKRFREQRLARFCFWMLAILYVISLCSELVCNSDPLYVRFNGESYFPVFRYYPEDTFLANGKQTRPDYKKMELQPVFADRPGNYMVFPMLKYGPFESVAPTDLVASQDLSLTFSAVPRLATVNVRDDGTISRSASFGTFADKEEYELRDTRLSDWMTVPDDLKKAMDARFANRDQGSFETQVTLSGYRVTVSMGEYTERADAPKTVRLKFEENKGTNTGSILMTFDLSLTLKGGAPPLWDKVPDVMKTSLLDKLKVRNDRPVDPVTLDIDKDLYRVEFGKRDIRFPYPPVAGHLLGIDEAGRDVLARILYGLRISLTFGLILVACSMALGISAGAVQGYYGGMVDISAQRLIEIWSALPFLYVMILMGSVYGRSFVLLLFCYGIFNWITISYYVRAEFLRLRKQPFVEAAKCLGIPPWKIIFKHIMPNAMVPVITFFPFSLVGAIGSLAALDYLGFGLPPPTPSWGELLSQAQQYRWAWWLILYPALALFIVMLLGVFIGEGIRNAYDPKRYTRLE